MLRQYFQIHRRVRSGIALAAATMLAVSCTALPEENSGKDAYRHVAEEMPLDEWAVDKISSRDGDTTDWKFVMLAQPTAFLVELSADHPETEIRLGVYDRYGMRIASQVRTEQSPVVKLQVPKTKRNGKHFLMVQALDGPGTDYQVRVKVGGASSGGDPNLPDF